MNATCCSVTIRHLDGSRSPIRVSDSKVRDRFLLQTTAKAFAPRNIICPAARGLPFLATHLFGATMLKLPNASRRNFKSAIRNGTFSTLASVVLEPIRNTCFFRGCLTPTNRELFFSYFVLRRTTTTIVRMSVTAVTTSHTVPLSATG